MEQKSNRKPYVRPVEANWWQKKKFYTAYMLREGTSVLVLLFALEMLFCYFRLSTVSNKDLHSICGVVSYLSGFLGNPIMIIFNLLVLVAVLYHAFTWFPLMPKALRVIVHDKKSGLYKLLDGKLLVVALFSLMALATLVGLFFFFMINTGSDQVGLITKGCSLVK